MKNRFNRLLGTLLLAVPLSAGLGLICSCSDDYDLDETMPSFLGGSIYNELKDRGDFTYTVRLIEDLDYVDVLAKTGSKTLFVAADSAYETFFRSGEFKKADGTPVTCYDELSTSQKRLLLNGSMLNNAFVLEMMTTMQGPVKNLCLRQLSAQTASDSIRFWNWYELPENLSERAVAEGIAQGTTAASETEVDYWRLYRQPNRSGIYMALDKTQPLLLHFLEGQMNEKKIKHSDIAFILNEDGTWPEDEGRSYAFGNKIIEQDVTCLNGYFHVMDKVLVQPQNMAEVIRTSGKTNYFSQMLDRFSAPYYDADLTQQYKQLHAIDADSIFQKVYLAQRSSLVTSSTTTITAPGGGSIQSSFPFLSYDPGWNAYEASSTNSKEQDMAAMFVPNDDAVENYFLNGGGVLLIERYGTKPNTKENLSYNLYQIPLNIIKPLIANLMKDSFNESVPSKYLTIMNDAQDPMFSGTLYATVEDYKRLFDEVRIANNGIVYIMNAVIAPATYSSVMAPVLRSTNTQVVNSVLHADDAYIDVNYTSAPLRKFYSTYLLAMQSRFSFFVPTDDGLKNYGYLDPVAYSFGAPATMKYWTFEYSPLPASASGAYLSVLATAYQWRPGKPMDPANDNKFTGAISAANQLLTSQWGPTKKNLLTELIDQHIVVHDNDDTEGVLSQKDWYVSRSGAPVHITKHGTAANKGIGMQVQGGLQIDFENNEYEGDEIVCEVTESYDMTRETNDYGNGMTYFLSRPMQPSMSYVVDVMGGDEEKYGDFYNLCSSLTDADGVDVLAKVFRSSEMTSDEWATELNKYRIFTNVNRTLPGNKRVVRFFNNYRYTIYVPTNEAVQREIAKGLPTMTEIQEFVEQHYDEEEGWSSAEDSIQAAAQIVTLTNFVKYHFQDLSVFVESGVSQAEQQCQTSCQDQETGGFRSVYVSGTPGSLTVRDASGQSHSVIAPYNILARDMELDASTVATARAVSNSSYVVIHQLESALCFDSALKDDYSSAWSSPKKAKAFLQKYLPKN